MKSPPEVSELEPFINEKDEGPQRRRPGAPRYFSYKAALFHAFLISLYTLTFLGLCYSKDRKYLVLSNGTQIRDSPLRCQADVAAALQDVKIRVKPKLSITTGESPWVGDPGGPTDHAWHQLVGNTSIRVTNEELKRNGNHQQSIPLPNGGGNLVWLGVYHQIHCLVRNFSYFLLGICRLTSSAEAVPSFELPGLLPSKHDAR